MRLLTCIFAGIGAALLPAAPWILLSAGPAWAAKPPPDAAAAPAQAGLPDGANAKEPIEISAAHSLEWNRRAKSYTAKVDAIAKQGHVRLDSDTLTANYDEINGKNDIYRLTASNHVIIRDPPYTAYGDLGVYEVKPQIATLTGRDLRIVTDTEKVTARDKIEFFQAENRLTATGQAVAVRGADTLKADVLNAYFQKDQWGRTAMHHVTAEGNVVVMTDKETAYGDHGTYDIPTQKAVLTGKVRLYQGKDHLEGTRADVDMNTGISQLFGTGNKATEGRVTGVFYPKAGEGKDKDKSAVKASSGAAAVTPSTPAPSTPAPSSPAPATPSSPTP